MRDAIYRVVIILLIMIYKRRGVNDQSLPYLVNHDLIIITSVLSAILASVFGFVFSEFLDDDVITGLKIASILAAIGYFIPLVEPPNKTNMVREIIANLDMS